MTTTKSATAATAPGSVPKPTSGKIPRHHKEFHQLLGQPPAPKTHPPGLATVSQNVWAGSQAGAPEPWSAHCSVAAAGGLDEGPAGVTTGSEREQLPLIDPLELVFALPQPSSAPTRNDTPRADFAAAVEEVVRRISWGGDRRSGMARIELGAGALKGAVIVVRAEEGRRVAIELALPRGADGAALERRLRDRLTSRGIDLSELSVV